MSSEKVVIDIVPESSRKGQGTLSPDIITAQPSESSSSWVPSWLSGAAAGALRNKSQATSTTTADVEKGLLKVESVKRRQSIGAADKPERLPPVLLLPKHSSRRMSVSEQEHSSMVVEKASSHTKPDESKRKAKVQIIPRAGTMKSNFSYDTLKERADVWRKERGKRPSKPAPLEREDSFIERPTDRSRKSIYEFAGHGEETNRPKIRFTPEESDKVDKDILRLMGALEHSRYPFNRDKHHLFSKNCA